MWQRQQAERAAVAKAGGAGAAVADASTAAAARVPGVTDAFYAKLAAALEVHSSFAVNSQALSFEWSNSHPNLCTLHCFGVCTFRCNERRSKF